jgi:hypothetical protein
MREEDKGATTTIAHGIDRILECGFRYAKFKMSLRRNRRKANNRDLSYSYLLRRIKEEVNELEQALIDSGIIDKEECGKFKNTVIEARPTYSIEEIALEAADIINFAAMICDKTEEIE